MKEYTRYDAVGLAELVASRQVHPRELLAAAIARAEAVNPQLNAIVHKMYEEGERLAALPPTGAFGGVPFLLKDLGIYYQGFPMSMGSKACRRYVPDFDSTTAQRYKAGGLVVFGKTNTPEFGLVAYTEPEIFGPCRNPWNPERTPGGSSGGAAAAVAAGIVPVASASDGGGSIRIPSSYCGLFGLKPTRGRVPCGPAAAEIWQGAAIEHVISRSVRDSAAMLDLLQGPDAGAPYIIPPPAQPYHQAIRQPPPRLRIGLCLEHPTGADIHPDCRQAAEQTAKLLESLGHDIVPVPLPYDGHRLFASYLVMYFCEIAATLSLIGQRIGRRITPKDVETATYTLGLVGQSYHAGEALLAKQQWNELGRSMGRFFGQYDLLLTPVTAMPPQLIGETAPKAAEIAGMQLANHLGLGSLLRKSGIVFKVAQRNIAKTPFTQIANLSGLPAMSVPGYYGADGLPAGAHFIAGFGREDLLLQLAASLEQARPWAERRPTL